MKSTLSRILRKQLTKKYFIKKLKNAKNLIKNLKRYQGTLNECKKAPYQEFARNI